MKSNWETYNGKRLFFARYDYLSQEEFRAELSAADKELYRQPQNSVLLLIETTGTMISPDVLNLFKNSALRAKPFVRKTAVLGVTGARRTMLDLVVKFSGMQVMVFETAQQAKEWLVQA